MNVIKKVWAGEKGPTLPTLKEGKLLRSLSDVFMKNKNLNLSF
jgi:hypothetical protein